MSQVHSFQTARRTARIASGLFGAAIGLGVIAFVVDGMGSRSHGQSLGSFMAQQRAIASNPVAQVAPGAPAATPTPITPAPRRGTV